MKVKELIDRLKLLKGDLEVYVAGDEEWNTVRSEIDVALHETDSGTANAVVISGLDGSEIDIEEEIEE